MLVSFFDFLGAGIAIVVVFSFFLAARVVCLIVYRYTNSTPFFLLSFAVSTNTIIVFYCTIYTIFGTQLNRKIQQQILDKKKARRKSRRLLFTALTPWSTLLPTVAACYLAAFEIYSIYIFAVIIFVAVMAFTIFHVLMIELKKRGTDSGSTEPKSTNTVDSGASATQKSTVNSAAEVTEMVHQDAGKHKSREANTKIESFSSTRVRVDSSSTSSTPSGHVDSAD